jgi:hypothetical protein
MGLELIERLAVVNSVVETSEAPVDVPLTLVNSKLVRVQMNRMEYPSD